MMICDCNKLSLGASDSSSIKREGGELATLMALPAHDLRFQGPGCS